jgi:hypothetical protein
MTARMAVPSQIALKKRDLAPKADFTRARDRDLDRGVDVVRAKATKSNNSAASASEIDVDKPLTEKQKAFVQSWAKGNSIGRASLDAGFADDGIGYRLVRQPNILALRDQYTAKYEATAEMDRKQVMDGLKESIEMAKLMSEPSTMIQGWKTIAQMCGYMAPVETKLKIDVTGNVTMTRLTQLSDAELLEMIERGAQHASPQLLIDETPRGEPD